MPYQDHKPGLHDALEETAPPQEPRRRRSDKPPPPPPQDWTSNVITRIVVALVLTGIIILAAIKAPDVIEYLKQHPYGAGIAAFIIFMLIFIILFAYWRYRLSGDRDEMYWTTERRKKPK
ncbi:MAG TPA: hypothetical protein VGB30_10900 [bacterium]